MGPHVIGTGGLSGLAGRRATGRRAQGRLARGEPRGCSSEAMDEAAGAPDAGQERRWRAAGGAVVEVVAVLAGAAHREGGEVREAERAVAGVARSRAGEGM